MVNLFDLTPETVITPPETPWAPERKPSEAEILGHALAARARQPAALGRVLVRSARSVAGLVRDRVTSTSTAPSPPLPFTAPRTVFNGAITPHRSVAFGRTSLEDMRLIKRTFGTTVNDVVLAATAGSLRRWLDAHGGVPDRPLVASVPISVRAEGQAGSLGNKVSAMLAALPVQLADPVERLRAVAESTKGAKEIHGALGADMLGDWAEFAAPALFARAARLYSGMKLADRHPPIHNLVVSNIPGPPIPLYCAGARVVAIYPMGPILEGAGLNVTIISFMGSVDFSAIACRELVPDVASIASGFIDAVAELKKAAEAAPPA
jgi:WS/DGAT/MGAT family acyltransferase